MRNLRTTFKEVRQLLPLLILAMFCANLVILAVVGKADSGGKIYDFSLTFWHFSAILLVAICFVFYFFYEKYLNYILGATILLGVFNLIGFSAFRISVGFFVNRLEVSFQPHAFCAGLIWFLLNVRTLIKSAFTGLQPAMNSVESGQVAYEGFNEAKEEFKERFVSYSDENLLEVIRDHRFVPAAKEAAVDLLSDRQSGRA